MRHGDLPIGNHKTRYTKKAATIINSRGFPEFNSPTVWLIMVAAWYIGDSYKQANTVSRKENFNGDQC